MSEVSDAMLERIYQAYPRHDGKAAAYKAIKKAATSRFAKQAAGDIPTVNFLLIVAGDYAEFCRAIGKKKEYTPMPATWFNGARYLDEDFQEWREKQGVAR